MHRWGRWPFVALFALVAPPLACAGGEGDGGVALARGPVEGGLEIESTSEPGLTATTAAPTTTLAPTTTTIPIAPPVAAAMGGRPVAAGDPAGLADQIVAAETAVRDPATPPDVLAAAAHLQQVAYRQLGMHPEWDAEVLARVPPALHQAVTFNAAARREFRGMHRRLSDTLPTWRIVDPPPAAELIAHYQEAEAVFGVAWEYLAAINLVETGMGRIRGTSVAGAQGPMQFMPATWDAFGEGDINSPRDAILAAGRYLAHNGFAEGNVAGALYNYNHHNNYVRGVTYYAQLIEADPQAFHGFYHWQIYYLSTAGDVLLPVGYEATSPIPATEYLAANPQ